MEHINIFNNPDIYNDNRGTIADIFYKSNINHVAMIISEPNVIRGHHYHKETTQYILITSGSLEYWYKNYDSSDTPKMKLCVKGDLIMTKPFEIHTLKITNEGNEFIVFSIGKRGGKDYELDTYRVEPII